MQRCFIDKNNCLWEGWIMNVFHMLRLCSCEIWPSKSRNQWASCEAARATGQPRENLRDQQIKSCSKSEQEHTCCLCPAVMLDRPRKLPHALGPFCPFFYPIKHSLQLPATLCPIFKWHRLFGQPVWQISKIVQIAGNQGFHVFSR